MSLRRKNNRCAICGSSKLKKILSLGKTALANGFLTRAQLTKPEKKFPLSLCVCLECGLLQLGFFVDSRIIFKNYHYFSGASVPAVKHFQKYANSLWRRFPIQRRGLIVDIGSNDGTFLGFLKKKGANVLGVDPAKGVATLAAKAGINTLIDFFGEETGRKITSKYVQASIITANNVLAHTPDLHDFLTGVDKLLAPNGIFIVEVQYALDLLQKNEFDNMYHEHYFYFALHPLMALLKIHQMEVFDLERVEPQGGSLRVYIKRASDGLSVSDRVAKILSMEKSFMRYSEYKSFAQQAFRVKHELPALLRRLKKSGKSIAGYGAPAKGNTLLQYCKIGPDLIDYIIDSTPAKQGKFTPGTHIPVLQPDHLHKNPPDYILLLAWNYADHILQKEKFLRNKGIRVILPRDGVKIL